MWCRTRIARAGTCKRRSRQSRALKSARHAPSCAGQYKILPSSAAFRNPRSRGRKNSTWCRARGVAISTPSGLPSSSTVSSSSTIPACERACADRWCLARRQQPSVAIDRLPVVEEMQDVPKLRGLIAERGLAELLLQAIGHGLGQPGAAADIDRVAIRIVEEGAAAEVIGHLHMVARVDLLELRR